MFKKMILAGALAAAGMFAFGTTEAQAGGCGYGGGGFGYGSSAVFRGTPYRSSFRSVPVYRSNFHAPVRSFNYGPSYRSGFRGGYGVSPFGFGHPHSFGRRGVSIGFGF